MSEEVKRYGYGYVDDGNGNRYLGLIEKPDGNLVKHEDYKALLAERDAAQKDADRYRAFRKAGLPNGLGVYDAELDAACDELIEDQREDA